ncbi:MAG: OmpH family outer membrane protein [Flavobacteriales bacterium]|nr:OmpH family outer membrane protein [Flavobacteriales bacterium]
MRLILAIGVALVLGACGEKKEVEKSEVDSSSERMVEGSAKDMEGMKVAFYNLDSLKTMYTYFREQDSIITIDGLNFQRELERRGANLQSFITKNEANIQKGLMSQDDIMKIQQQAQQRQEVIMQYQQSVGGDIEKRGYDVMEIIGNRLQEYGGKFSKDKGIDILMVYTKGGQFNYINGSLDVTKEFTDYLNKQQEEMDNLN